MYRFSALFGRVEYCQEDERLKTVNILNTYNVRSQTVRDVALYAGSG